MTIEELNTLHLICELEGTHLLAILSISIHLLHLAGYLLYGNRGNFLYVEGSIA